MGTVQTTQSPPGISPTTPDDSVPLVSKTWVQGVALVLIFGFFMLGIMTVLTYKSQMPVPDKVVTSSGQTVFTGNDIIEGQEIFQARGLMQYGSVLGHGAYLGEDYTAEYLRKAAEDVTEQYKREGMPDPHNLVVSDFRTNRYDPDTKTLVFTDKDVVAYHDLEKYYAQHFGPDSGKYGLIPNMITDPSDIHKLTAFFAWTAWSAAANRPGHDYSYTNNWPAEKLVENEPTGQVVVWSALSLIALIGGLGAALTIYGRWSARLGWERSETKIAFRQPGDVPLTKSQRAVVVVFVLVALMFLAQTVVGGAAAHYRSDLGSFFGIELNKIMPFNLARTWHLQLAIFWTSIAFLGGGIFLTPFISRKEPEGQATLVKILAAILAVVVFGSMAFEALSITGKIAPGTLTSQQWEFLDLPRLFQMLLVGAMFVWLIIIGRGMSRRLQSSSKINLPWVFFFTGLTIPTFYAVSLLAGSSTHFAVADFWRYWMVHLWVEDFLELFTTVMVAYIFVLLGVVREKVALTLIYADIILYSAGGLPGTMHHIYFSGVSTEIMAVGAFFSAAEVVPLTLLTVEAWAFMQLGAREQAGGDKNFPARWCCMFLVAAGFWNFFGAGIFGFLINLPIVSYYETGTGLTPNHAHGSLFGVYGMLALALAMFVFRYVTPVDKWPHKLAQISFWGCNIGLILMMFSTLLPLGALQLVESVGHGYYEARSLGYITKPRNILLEWIRLPGDTILILFGAVPMCLIALNALRYMRGKTVDEIPEDALYVEVPVEEKAVLQK